MTALLISAAIVFLVAIYAIVRIPHRVFSRDKAEWKRELWVYRTIRVVLTEEKRPIDLAYLDTLFNNVGNLSGVGEDLMLAIVIDVIDRSKLQTLNATSPKYQTTWLRLMEAKRLSYTA